MANYENIRPYAEFAHIAAEHGGVANYLDEIAAANRELGILEERDTEGWKAAIVLGAGLLLWETGKAGLRSFKKYSKKRREEKMEALKRESDAAKEAIIQEMNEYNDIAADDIED